MADFYCERCHKRITGRSVRRIRISRHKFLYGVWCKSCASIVKEQLK